MVSYGKGLGSRLRVGVRVRIRIRVSVRVGVRVSVRVRAEPKALSGSITCEQDLKEWKGENEMNWKRIFFLHIFNEWNERGRRF
jgi:hypothetical protein